MIVRPATPADTDAIARVERTAFGCDDEARLVEALAADGDVVASLVAEDVDGIVGHVLLSRLDAPFAAVALGPLAVVPARQREGTGGALVRAAADAARAAGADAVFLLGDPAYYGRFGYDAAAAAGFDTPYAGEAFQVLALSGALPMRSGRITYAPAFAAIG